MTLNDQDTTQQPVLFLPHGGGPCFFMEWGTTWDRMAAYLRSVGPSLARRPDAIVVMSGHWETSDMVVGSAAHPSLIYDYYGFPPHTYQLEYPVPGSPTVAGKSVIFCARVAFSVQAMPRADWITGSSFPSCSHFPMRISRLWRFPCLDRWMLLTS